MVVSAHDVANNPAFALLREPLGNCDKAEVINPYQLYIKGEAFNIYRPTTEISISAHFCDPILLVKMDLHVSHH